MGSGSIGSDDDRLRELLEQLTETYRSTGAFRRSLTSRKVEGILPTMTDFATITASSARPAVRPQREAAANWLQALLDLGKLGNNLNNQVRGTAGGRHQYAEQSLIMSSSSSSRSSL